MENLSYYTDLIQGYLEGTSPREDLLELLGWLKQSEEHIQYFNQVCNAWEGGHFPDDSILQAELALVKLHKRIAESEKITDLALDDQKSNRILWLIRIAAILIGFVILIPAVWYFIKNEPGSELQQVTAIAPPSQKSQIVLADGTKVWLNSGTHLRYSNKYGDKLREVFLDGEAFFEVAKNPEKPFLVHASHITVRALGTSFNIKSYADDKTIETTLIEGKVEVTGSVQGIKGNSKVVLSPKEKATFLKDERTIAISVFKDEKSPAAMKSVSAVKVENSSIAAVTSWKDQMLVFENESFENLVKLLERWYDIRILLQNESLNKNMYTGKFGNNESIEQVLKVISRTTPMKYTIKDRTITIE